MPFCLPDGASEEGVPGPSAAAPPPLDEYPNGAPASVPVPAAAGPTAALLEALPSIAEAEEDEDEAMEEEARRMEEEGVREGGGEGEVFLLWLAMASADSESSGLPRAGEEGDREDSLNNLPTRGRGDKKRGTRDVNVLLYWDGGTLF